MYRAGELKDALRNVPDAAEVIIKSASDEHLYPTGRIRVPPFKTAAPWQSQVFILVTTDVESKEEEYQRHFWDTVNSFRETLEEAIVGLPPDHELVKTFDLFIKNIDGFGHDQ